MPSRLPTVGADANDWGTTLNDFLQQALVGNSGSAPGTLVTTAINSWTGSANTNLSSNSQPGLVQLSGDLSGTAASPVVAALRGKALSTITPSDGYVLTWSAANSWWQPIAPVGGGGGSISGAIDGGNSSTVYGGGSSINGGDST